MHEQTEWIPVEGNLMSHMLCNIAKQAETRIRKIRGAGGWYTHRNQQSARGVKKAAWHPKSGLEIKTVTVLMGVLITAKAKAQGGFIGLN